MTPVREALKEAIDVLEGMNDDEINLELLPRLKESLSAAPGEPCAWYDPTLSDPDHPFITAVNKRALDSRKSKAWSIPLYTTPQPAAGWDEAIERVQSAYEELCVRFSGAHSDRAMDSVLLRLYVALKSLRREAPAPAEGVAHTPAQFVDDVLSACDASNWDAELNTGDYFRGLRDAYERIHELAGEYQSSMYAWSRPSARPDTAEARLRELLNGRDGFIVSKGLWTEFTNTLPRTPPSGGDEAKESEGGCICQDQHRRGYCTEPGCPYAVRPSEPSPPADRAALAQSEEKK